MDIWSEDKSRNCNGKYCDVVSVVVEWSIRLLEVKLWKI